MDIEGRINNWNKNKQSIEFYPVGKASIKNQLKTFVTNGKWIVFKNGHLDPDFLKELKNCLEDNNNTNLKVFVTAENSDKIHNNFLEISHKIVFEKSTNIQENMMSTWNKFSSEDQPKDIEPNFFKIMFGITVLHNALTVRDRFRP